MTLVTVSNKLGISYQQVQKYEQATTKISASTLFRLAELYEVGVEKFFEGVRSKRPFVSTALGSGDPGEDKSDEVCILLVEDNPGDEAVTRHALREFKNLNVLCVHDGLQALDVLKYKRLCSNFPRPCVVLSDIFIPKRDGLSLLRELKRDRQTQGIPVVFVTDNISQDLITQAYQAGASGYICKSFNFDEFKANIFDCIRYWTMAVSLPGHPRPVRPPITGKLDG